MDEPRGGRCRRCGCRGRRPGGSGTWTRSWRWSVDGSRCTGRSRGFMVSGDTGRLVRWGGSGLGGSSRRRGSCRRSRRECRCGCGGSLGFQCGGRRGGWCGSTGYSRSKSARGSGRGGCGRRITSAAKGSHEEEPDTEKKEPRPPTTEAIRPVLYHHPLLAEPGSSRPEVRYKESENTDLSRNVGRYRLTGSEGHAGNLIGYILYFCSS